MIEGWGTQPLKGGQGECMQIKPSIHEIVLTLALSFLTTPHAQLLTAQPRSEINNAADACGLDEGERVEGSLGTCPLTLMSQNPMLTFSTPGPCDIHKAASIPQRSDTFQETAETPSLQGC